MSHKKSDTKFDQASTQPDYKEVSEPSEPTLQLLTVEQDQRRLDARRRTLRVARELDRHRRLQAVFGSSSTARDRTLLN